MTTWIATHWRQSWRRLPELTRYLMPFADAATKELPMSRLLRLSLFQISVGMALVLVIGTLNRVMIVELGVSAWIVGVMISLPLLFAPFRALIGFRSDVHKSYLGWRRIPYMVFGTMLQWGGFAIMPMALIVLSGDSRGPEWLGPSSAALAFLLVGAGLHTTQTVGLALATDLAPAHARPKVVALLCAMLLVGMVASSVIFGWLLADFTQIGLIKVIQGAAVVTLVLNTIALWQQEARDPNRHLTVDREPRFAEMWAVFNREGGSKRRLFALGIGTAAFSMQDVLLEPYGGEILKLSVGATTALTGLLAIGGVLGLMLAARQLGRGADPYRVAANGALVGIAAFSAVICAAPLETWQLFACGVALIGFGGGLFAHATLTAAMEQTRGDKTGFALGMWGSVQATAAGLAIALGGIVRDAVGYLSTNGHLGEALADPVTGYGFVYHIEIVLLFCALVAIGPLVRRLRPELELETKPMELAGSRG